MDQELYKKRHSLAHILAQAVQREQQRDVEVGIWPSIDNGLYYDFLFSKEKQLKEEDLKKLQNQMEKIVKEWQNFTILTVTKEDSDELVNKVMEQKYKDEMRLEFLEQGEDITFYVNTIVAAAKDNVLRWVDENYLKYYQKITTHLQSKYPWKFDDKFVTFLDMCEWPHVDSTKEIDPKSFKVEKLAGAYRRWDENNVMMTRVYVRAFESKEKLKEYSDLMEEAKKRDHRVLGKKLWLYKIDQDVWSWLILRKPKWAFIVNQIKRRFEDEQLKAGYVPVLTPHIWKKKLREQSGHRGFYNEGMFPPIELGHSLWDRQDNRKAKESEIYLLKPMNCPAHVKIYTDDIHSYRELPLRYYEFGTVYRYEQQWELGWLTRVRWFTQDDAHIMVSKDGLKEEFGKVVDFAFKVLKHFDFNDVKIYASFSDPKSDKYVWDKEMWKKAEWTIREILADKKIDYEEELWEAAFYGPKIDFKVKDVIGRERQLSTVQFDFNLPERFDMSFTNAKWEQERPFMIHRALLGSLERFMGVLIENYAWAFPMRLAPEQIKIIAVADKFNDYAEKIKAELLEKWYRVSIDYTNDSFSKKIRNGELNKIPYLFILWEKEETDNSISRRSYKTKEQGICNLDQFIKDLSK